MSFDYIAQPAPDGIAQAYILAEDFLDGAPSALVLGDNLFFGHDLPVLLKKAGEETVGRF
jgi:glucose-1-phosphate thymidylyltransferase